MIFGICYCCGGLNFYTTCYFSQLTTKEIKCNDNGSGCEIVRISDTSNLNIGDHNVIVIVKDELGYRYKYIIKIICNPFS